jgi:hypothetical protein
MRDPFASREPCLDVSLFVWACDCAEDLLEGVDVELCAKIIAANKAISAAKYVRPFMWTLPQRTAISAAHLLRVKSRGFGFPMI